MVRALGGAALGIGIAVGAAYLLGVHADALIDSLAHVPSWAVAGCIASGFVVIALQALRWSSVMRPLLGVRYTEAYRVQVAVAMLNALIPARGGDLLRIQYFGRVTGKSRATILGREIVDRWLDFSGWIPTFAIVCLLGEPPAWLLKALGGFSGILILWAVVMIVLGRRGYRPDPDSRRVGQAREARSGVAPASPTKPQKAAPLGLGKLWAALKSGIDAFGSRRILWIALFLAPLPWLWETFVIMRASVAFGLDLSLVQAFSVLMAFNLAMAVPSPGAVGTIEAGGTAALVFFGFDQSKALAFMLVYHMAQLLPAVFAGALVLSLAGKDLMKKSEAPVFALDVNRIGPANTNASTERGGAGAGL